MNKKRVLVIDDEEDYLRITKLNLEETGNYSVATLISAKDTITYLHSFKPDIILLDMCMPEVGGLDVCQMLNNDSFGAGIPLIIVSALGKHEDKLGAYRAGAVYYISKPVSKDDLIARIEKALSYKEKST